MPVQRVKPWGCSAISRRPAWADEAADVESGYRDELIHDLTWHDFRGIYQFKQNIRLPLADIYQELGFLKVGNAAEHRDAARAAAGAR